MAATTAPAVDRRAHVRFSASRLSGLKSARVKYGQDISVIDLSSGGVLFETSGKLSHEATIVLEFAGPADTVLVPSRVVRCRTLATIDYSLRSEGACAFKRPLKLKDIVTGTAPSASNARLAEDSGTVSWHPVIGKYRDGRLVRGHTNDFNPSKTYMHVYPTPTSSDSQFVGMIELDAIFFLRNSSDDDKDNEAALGRRVALRLPNGEEMIGSTLNYSRNANGIFIHPADSSFGLSRVFVTQNGIRNIRFL